MILFELSGEDRNLAVLEILSLLETYSVNWKIIREHRNAILLEGDRVILPILARRVAYTRRIAEVVAEVDPLQVSGADLKIGEKRFAIGSRKVDEIEYSMQSAVEAIGNSILQQNQGSRVDLENPEIRVELFGAMDRLYLSTRTYPVNRKAIDSRMPKLRPVQTPVGMHPRLARLMVNLAHVREGDVVVDPFCGTGGILLEASEMGMHAIGIDIQEKMVLASRKNLAHYGLKGVVTHGDATRMIHTLTGIGVTHVDAIVSDLPYGRSSTLAGKGLQELLDQFLIQADALLTEGKFMVLCINNETLLENSIAKTSFRITRKFKQRVHKSLTRYFFLLKT